MAGKRRSPWALVLSGLGALVLALVVLVVGAMSDLGAGFLVVAAAGLVAVLGLALLIAGAVGLGVRAGRG